MEKLNGVYIFTNEGKYFINYANHDSMSILTNKENFIDLFSELISHGGFLNVVFRNRKLSVRQYENYIFILDTSRNFSHKKAKKLLGQITLGFCSSLSEDFYSKAKFAHFLEKIIH